MSELGVASAAMSGALDGLKVIDAGGIGPGPFAAMLLADMGADVLRIESPRLLAHSDVTRPPNDLFFRGRRSVAIDIKDPRGLDALLALVERADVLIEGFRPGVAERLGFGPDVCLARCPRLIYGRMTGWGQDGPLAEEAGHDINYIAVAGVLAHIGRRGDRPVPPLNLIGDSGGGMSLAFGIVCALLEAQRSGLGQVIDASMVDGAALFMTMMHGVRANGTWHDELGTNGVDGGAPHYDVYETADGRHVAIGAFEHRFFRVLIDGLGIEVDPRVDHLDPASWPQLREQIAAAFRGRTRDEWGDVFAGKDACFSPVLTLAEATEHPHNRARQTFIEVDGVVQPAPAPRLARTPGAVRWGPPPPGRHTRDAMLDWGIERATIDELASNNVIAWPRSDAPGAQEVVA